MIAYMIFNSMHPVKSGIGPLNELLSSHLQPKDIWIMMLQGSSILVELIMEIPLFLNQPSMGGGTQKGHDTKSVGPSADVALGQANAPGLRPHSTYNIK